MTVAMMRGNARPDANVRAPGLKVRERAAGRYLEPRADTRRVGLQVVRLCARESRVASRQELHAVWKPEPLEQCGRVTRHELVLVRGILRRRISHELDLVELVDSQDAARVLSRGARLAAEAGRVRA